MICVDRNFVNVFLSAVPLHQLRVANTSKWDFDDARCWIYMSRVRLFRNSAKGNEWQWKTSERENSKKENEKWKLVRFFRHLRVTLRGMASLCPASISLSCIRHWTFFTEHSTSSLSSLLHRALELNQSRRMIIIFSRSSAVRRAFTKAARKRAAAWEWELKSENGRRSRHNINLRAQKWQLRRVKWSLRSKTETVQGVVSCVFYVAAVALLSWNIPLNSYMV